MTPAQWRKFSSDEVINALVRAGFREARKAGGSHQALIRAKPQGGHWTVIVPLGYHEIKTGTLQGILEQADMRYEEFEVWAKVRHKGRKR